MNRWNKIVRSPVPAGIAAAFTLWQAVACAALGLAINGPTTQWVAILYGNNYPDDPQDQQTGSTESDLIGNATHPSFYTQFDDAGTPSLTDGTLAFRVRLGQDKNPPGFTGALFVGFDANADGALDLFVGVNNSGSANQIAIYNPGSGLNISPSTTTISAPIFTLQQTAANYNWTAVTPTIDPFATSFDLNADGGTDHFLSFSVPFTNVVNALQLRGISINQNSPLRYVVATATQANSLNQDLNGVRGSINSSLTWAQLGAITLPYSASGVQIPEPNNALLVLLGLLPLYWTRHRLAR